MIGRIEASRTTDQVGRRKRPSGAVSLCRKSVTSKGRAYEYWELRWFDLSGKRRSETLGRVKDLSRRAAEKARRLKSAAIYMNPRLMNVGGRTPLGPYLEMYLESRRQEIRPGTLVLHEQTCKYLKACFGDRSTIDSITRSEARRFKTMLGGGELAAHPPKPASLTIATVNLHVRNARTIFAHAVSDDLLTMNPFDRLAEARLPPKDWHYVSGEELAALQSTARPEWKLMLSLCRLAGLRRGEALALTWGQVDLERRRLRVIAKGDFVPKDKEARTVPICRELSQLLGKIRTARSNPDRPIISKQIIVQNVNRDFASLCERAGVTAWAKPLHTLRKSCLTDWASAFPLHVVQEWAGHSSIETTQRFYLKVSDTEYVRASELGSPVELSSGLSRRVG